MDEQPSTIKIPYRNGSFGKGLTSKHTTIGCQQNQTLAQPCIGQPSLAVKLY